MHCARNVPPCAHRNLGLANGGHAPRVRSQEPVPQQGRVEYNPHGHAKPHCLVYTAGPGDLGFGCAVCWGVAGRMACCSSAQPRACSSSIRHAAEPQSAASPVANYHARGLLRPQPPGRMHGLAITQHPLDPWCPALAAGVPNRSILGQTRGNRSYPSKPHGKPAVHS